MEKLLKPGYSGLKEKRRFLRRETFEACIERVHSFKLPCYKGKCKRGISFDISKLMIIVRLFISWF